MRAATILGFLLCALGSGPALAEAPGSGAAPAVFEGPAWQFEGKWMATLQTAAGTPVRTLATCADPLVLVADSGAALRREDGSRITVAAVDDSTITWAEGGRSTLVTPEAHGSFMALQARGETANPDPGRVVAYLRCGTAGASAAQQVCVAE